MALSGETASQAALEAEGGELPLSVVRAPVGQIDVLASDASAIWMENVSADILGNVSVKQVQEYHMVMQSEVVIAALQRSLCVRAAELREGLRQWGFARAACTHTDEMANSFEVTCKERAAETAQIREESLRLQAELEDGRREVERLTDEYRKLEMRQSQQITTVHQIRAEIQDMEGQREAKRAAISEIVRNYDALSHDNLVCHQRLKESAGELAGVPAEVAFRASAAETLALRAEEQVRRSQEQLEQTRLELASFEASHSQLIQMHAILGQELEEQRQMDIQLGDEHMQLGFDLHSLAQHYMALVPELPGFELSEAPDTVRAANMATLPSPKASY
jgi:chromosome segregation ATPase